MYDEAMRGRLNEEVAILAIETGGRMHSQFHRLITAFARFKADKIAGPLPANARQGVGYNDSTDPAVKDAVRSWGRERVDRECMRYPHRNNTRPAMVFSPALVCATEQTRREYARALLLFSPPPALFSIPPTGLFRSAFTWVTSIPETR